MEFLEDRRRVGRLHAEPNPRFRYNFGPEATDPSCLQPEVQSALRELLLALPEEHEDRSLLMLF